jgi:hypothetical protein
MLHLIRTESACQYRIHFKIFQIFTKVWPSRVCRTPCELMHRKSDIGTSLRLLDSSPSLLWGRSWKGPRHCVRSPFPCTCRIPGSRWGHRRVMDNPSTVDGRKSRYGGYLGGGVPACRIPPGAGSLEKHGRPRLPGPAPDAGHGARPTRTERLSRVIHSNGDDRRSVAYASQLSAMPAS